MGLHAAREDSIEAQKIVVKQYKKVDLDVIYTVGCVDDTGEANMTNIFSVVGVAIRLAAQPEEYYAPALHGGMGKLIRMTILEYQKVREAVEDYRERMEEDYDEFADLYQTMEKIYKVPPTNE